MSKQTSDADTPTQEQDLRFIDAVEVARLLRVRVDDVHMLVDKCLLPEAYATEKPKGKASFKNASWKRPDFMEFLNERLTAFNRQQTAGGLGVVEEHECDWFDVVGAKYRSRKEEIWATCLELESNRVPVTRATLVKATGYNYYIVDDHASTLMAEGRLVRVASGVFHVVTPILEARSVSVTGMLDGGCKIEVGDGLLTLTASERRELARLLVGDAVQYSNIQAGAAANQLAGDLYNCLTFLRRTEAINVRLAQMLGISTEEETSKLERELGLSMAPAMQSARARLLETRSFDSK